MENLNNISLNFILSTGRTGSTLLCTMLNMHPEALSISEEPFAYNLYPKYKDVVNWTDKTIEEFCFDFYLFSEGKLPIQFGTKQDLVDLLTKHKEGLTGEKAIKLAYFAFFPKKDKSKVRMIVDKELKFHYFLNEVDSFYPTAKYIVLSRDPRDNVVVKINKAIKQARPYNLYFLAKMWDYQYNMLLAKTSKLDAKKVLHISYENLMTDPESTLKKVCLFLGLSFDEDMLKYDEKIKSDMDADLTENEKKHINLVHGGLTKKVSTEKMGIWKRDLKPEQYNTIWAICKTTALKYGYQQDSCEDKKRLSLVDRISYLKFIVARIIIPNVYYNLPYSLKYRIKKAKYGSLVSKGETDVTKFIEKSLPKK